MLVELIVNFIRRIFRLSQILRVNAFDGYINTFLPINKYPPSTFRQMDWMIGVYDWGGTNARKSIISKCPQTADIFTDTNSTGMTAGAARGMYYTWTLSTDNTYHFIFEALCTGGGTGDVWVRSVGEDATWYELTDTSITYDGTQTHWETIGEKVLWTFGGYLYKWLNFTGTTSTVSNISIVRTGDAVAAGVTLSWTCATNVDIWTKSGAYSTTAGDWTKEFANVSGSSYTNTGVVRSGTSKWYKILAVGATLVNADLGYDVLGKFDWSLPEGQTLISMPLIPTDTAIDVCIGQQLTGSTVLALSDTISHYNGTSYDLSFLNTTTNLWQGNVLTVVPDTAYWVNIRTGHGTTVMSIVGKLSNISRSISIPAGSTSGVFVGFCYPKTMTFDNSTLYTDGATGGTASTNSFVVYVYTGTDGSTYETVWLKAADNKFYDLSTGNLTVQQLTPGVGYWMRQPAGGAAFTWTVPLLGTALAITKAYNRAIVRVKDKGATATAITTLTLTWATTNTVTSSADCNAQIKCGDWIRKSSTSIYWDEVAAVSTDGLTIVLTAASLDTGASSAGGAQKAPGATTEARQIRYWKGKLWTLYKTTLSWSTTDTLGVFSEDFTSTGAGEILIDVIDSGKSEFGTGLEFLGEYLFVFREFSYLVYRWTGDVDEPIELVRSVAYGCNSQNTIQRVGDVIQYFTGNEVRVTNGGSDVSVSGPIDGVLSSNVLLNESYYSTTVAYGSSMPTSFYESHYGIYGLCLPTSTAGVEYWYDTKSKKWMGVTKWGIGAVCASQQLSGQTQLGRVLYHTTVSSNDPQYVKLGNTDFSNYAVIFSGGHDMGAPDKTKKIHWVEIEFVPQKGCNTNLYFDWWDFNATKDTPGTTLATNTVAKTEVLTLDADYTGSENYSKKIRFNVSGCEVYNFGWILFEDNTTPPSGDTASAGWGIAGWTIGWEPCDNP